MAFQQDFNKYYEIQQGYKEQSIFKATSSCKSSWTKASKNPKADAWRGTKF